MSIKIKFIFLTIIVLTGGCKSEEKDNVFYYELSGYECMLDEKSQISENYMNVVHNGRELDWYIPDDSTTVDVLISRLGCESTVVVPCSRFLPGATAQRESTCLALKAYGDPSGANPVSVHQSTDRATVIATATLRIEHAEQTVQLVPSPIVIQIDSIPSTYRFIVNGES